MQNTSPKQLRAEMKDYLDLAAINQFVFSADLAKFIFSESYEINFCHIEDYIFSATESLESVEHF